MAPGSVLLTWGLWSVCVVTSHFASGQGISDYYGTSDALENGAKSISSYWIYNSRNTATSWTLTTKTNTTLHFGSCYKSSHCSWCNSTYSSNIRLRICGSWTTISFTNISRQVGGQLSFSIRDNYKRTASGTTLLNVYQLPLLDNCSVEVTRHNWSAVLSCEVTRAFSTADMYTFGVQETYWLPGQCHSTVAATFHCLTAGDYHAHPRSVSRLCGHQDKRSFRHWLSPYLNKSDGKEYYRGRLVHSWKLSSVKNWAVRVDVCSGASSVTCAHFQRNMSHMEAPSRPTHNCTDVNFLAEKEEKPCVCSTQSLGTPVGKLSWKRGADVMAAAGDDSDDDDDDDARTLWLPATVWKREAGSAQQVECLVDWIEPAYARPRFTVAYGPDTVDIVAFWFHNSSNKPVIAIKCQVTGLAPRTTDMVQWTGPCQNQTGYTCILDPLEYEAEGLRVGCQVTNAANNGHSLQVARTITTGKMLGALKAADSSDGDDGVKWAAAGAAVMLAVLILLAVLLMLLVSKMRRRVWCPCSQPVQESPPSAQHFPDTHVYEGINMSRVTTTAKVDNCIRNNSNSNRNNSNSNRNDSNGKESNKINSNRNKGRRLPPEPKAGQVYENTHFDTAEGHI